MGQKVFKQHYSNSNMEGMRRRNTNRLVISLVVVIILLLGVIAYTFLIQPQFNAYVVSKQVEAQEMVVGSILYQIQQQGYVQIPTDVEGNVLTLIPYQEPNA